MNEQDLFAADCECCGFCAVGSEAFVTLQAGRHGKQCDCAMPAVEPVDLDELDVEPVDTEEVMEAIQDG